MNEFDRIIGYTAEKKELEQICDILLHQDEYERLGVKPPSGLLLHGKPGVGKTLMADILTKASGLRTFICRKNEPNGDFIKVINATFAEAAANAPAIVFLDDMDKFANEDSAHCNAEEYVTIQACIDEYKQDGIFILATCNDIDDLPESLLRAGRFDRVMEIKPPKGKDAEKIIDYYLLGKRKVTEINAGLISRMLDGRSCAELETIINDAGIYAGFERADEITMDHLMKACLSRVYGVPSSTFYEPFTPVNITDNYTAAAANIIHEAGHALVAEVLYPGCTTLVSALHKKDEESGFTMTTNYAQVDPRQWRIISSVIAMGGRAAIERYYGIPDEGSEKDIDDLCSLIDSQLGETYVYGFSLHREGAYYDSDTLKVRLEQSKTNLLEQYAWKAREILALNSKLLEQIAKELSVKGLLTTDDIKTITAKVGIVPVNIS